MDVDAQYEQITDLILNDRDAAEIDDGERYLKEISQDRTHTDVPFLIVHGISILILICLMIYCFVTGDIDRIIKGYDDCGNVCGKVNSFEITYSNDYFNGYLTNDFNHYNNCKALDMTDKPILLNGECVKGCDENSDPNCVSITIKKLIKKYSYGILQEFSGQLAYLSIIPIVISTLLILLLRYFTAFYVWFSLATVVASLSSLAGYFWYLSGTQDVLLALAIVFTILAILILLIILVIRHRIMLVIQIYKEAGKSIVHMPLIIFQPIVSCCLIILTCFCFTYFFLWIKSTGKPTYELGKVHYLLGGFEKFILFFNAFNMIWLIQFIYGCQHMLAAGAIAKWYFYRVKENIVNPISSSAINMIKYHLGTISIGSLLITLINILKIMFRYLKNRLKNVCTALCLCCIFELIDNFLTNIETFLNYFTRNIYIVTAIRGYSFYQSGTYVLQIIIKNILTVGVISCVGDFVLFLTKLLIVILSVFFGYLCMKNDDLNFVWPLILFGILSYLIGHCFVSVYEIAVDTIFVCFCEDCEVNDGISRPYFMSSNLMDFVEKSKKFSNKRSE